jgi:outer membrane protein assembly factor BamB
MNAVPVIMFAAVISAPLATAAAQDSATAIGSAAALAGAWAGFAAHDGERSLVALEFEPGDDGKALVRLSVPAMHVSRQQIGRVAVQVTGADVRAGPFAFVYDSASKTLSGILPRALVPFYDVPVVLRLVERLELPVRPSVDARQVEPAWVFDAGSALWAGPAVAAGMIHAGADDGRLYALDARTGTERWFFQAGGPIRTRAAIARDAVFFQADDGFLYSLSARSGDERWRVRVVDATIKRVPPGQPGSRYDSFGSDVVVAGERLYLGTHDGKVLALDAASGQRVWEFTCGDAVVAAPTVVGSNVYFGSYDHNVYGLDTGTGRLVWKYDTGAPVVSTPAVANGRVIVGSRSYDLLGLDSETGDLLWKRYVWFSWIESSASVRGRIGYVGSSDATTVFAFDARTGQPVWEVDVLGRALGRPAVSEDRVYVGTSGVPNYLSDLRGAVIAMDRGTGRPIWQFVPEPSTGEGPYGFPGSPALGADLVFVTGLDGRVYAFAK